MQRISGRVFLEESGSGVPRLIVTVFDVASSGTGPAPVDPVATPLELAAHGGVSLGSVITTADGVFTVNAEQSDAAAPRRDLVVTVRGPDAKGEGHLLYSSPAVRRQAGAVEEFLISLSSEALIAAGLTPPLGGDDAALERPKLALHGVKETLLRSTELEDELRTLAVQEVAKQRERDRAVDELFRPRFVEQITGNPSGQPGYIASDSSQEQVHAATWEILARTANRPKPPTVGYVQLAQDEVPSEFPAALDAPQEVPAEIVERELFGAVGVAFRSPARTREDPVALAADQASRQPSLEHALQTPSNGGAPGSTPDPSEPGLITGDDLPAYVHRLVEGMASPDAGPTETRADPAGVQSGTDEFALRPGPADVPAIYDFHNLQIAFDHVWTHAVDEQVIELSTELARAVTDAGGDPVQAIDAGAKPLQALRAELRHVQRAQTPTIPTSLARMAGTTTAHPAGTNDPGDPGDLGAADLPPDPPTPPIPPKPAPLPATGPVGAGVSQDPDIPRQPHELLDQLEELLQEPYSFELFAPSSVNYGLNVTYRQNWQRLAYQVGELVGTITLTPKETRKVTAKHVRRQERMTRELHDSLEVLKNDSKEQGRDEAEIVRRAQGKTNFSLAADGSYNIGISKGDAKTSFSTEASDESADTKKAMRDATLEASREYRDNNKTELDAKESSEFESNDSTEITNPNDELTVTYLFYELQRRFKISEQLHRLTPVVLVGMEVPNPSRRAIDSILLTHSWIINRVLLDDRYRPALTYLTTTIVGDELALRERLSTVNRLRAVVDTIERNHAALLQQVTQRNADLEKMMNLRAQKTGEQAQGGLFSSFSDWVTGEGEGDDLEAVRIREENARAYYEKAVRAEQELRDSLRSETAGLNKATADYAQALAEHSNRLLQVASLRIHFKANVLYYMQAIWSHTFRDQLYFSVHKLKAPTLRASSEQYMVERLAVPPANVVPKPGHVAFKLTATKVFSTPADAVDPIDPEADLTLAEVADLDNPLGFMGNYMIFPLKQSNALTDFMMTPYIDTELGVHDPDELGSWTPEDFVTHVKLLRETLPTADFDQLLPLLEDQYRRLISAPRRAEDEVVIPSHSLYIDALPGTHANLEDFKLRHRAVDVQEARAKVRRLELENLRFASRVLAKERDDPEIDKKITIQGTNGPIVVPPEA